jgi:hypothetical protein
MHSPDKIPSGAYGNNCTVFIITIIIIYVPIGIGLIYYINTILIHNGQCRAQLLNVICLVAFNS